MTLRKTTLVRFSDIFRQKQMLYISGAQHPAHDESLCGPQCPTRKVTVLSPAL